MRPLAVTIISAATAAALASAALADPADHGSPQAAVDAAYAVISGPNGAIDVARFDDVFTSGARFTMVLHGPDGKVSVRYFDAAAFKTTFAALMAGKPFYETGHTIHADVRGDVATILSDYESRAAPAAKPFQTGRNTFELVRGADGWRVDTIFWQAS